MDYASIPQPTAGPLSEDLIPQEIDRRGSFFGSFHRSMSFMPDRRRMSKMFHRSMPGRNIQVGEEAVAHSSAADAEVVSIATVEGRHNEHDEGKEEKGEDLPSTTSVGAEEHECSCEFCGFSDHSSSLQSTSDHRQQGSTKTPEWKKHVMAWLSKAVKSIPAYVERSTIVLVRIEKKNE